jgi:hypothetical protein
VSCVISRPAAYIARSILTIGFELASNDAQYEEFTSKTSLLDWDVILFKPLINDFLSDYDNYFQGKPSLEESYHSSLKRIASTGVERSSKH